MSGVLKRKFSSCCFNINLELFQRYAIDQYGIEKHNALPYTPKENEKVEQFWSTIEKTK